MESIFSLTLPEDESERVSSSEVPHISKCKGSDKMKCFFSTISDINQVARQ
jgi:hypothetical protein